MPASPSPQTEAPAPPVKYVPIPPGSGPFWTIDKLQDGLKMAKGIVSEACRMLRMKHNHSLGRSTMYNALKASPALKEYQAQCRGIIFDVCYHGIVGRAEDGNARDQRLLYGRLAAENGMPNPQTKKIELTGADGGPIQQQEVIGDAESELRKRIAALDDDELAALRQALKAIHELNVPKSVVKSAANGAVGGMGV